MILSHFSPPPIFAFYIPTTHRVSNVRKFSSYITENTQYLCNRIFFVLGKMVITNNGQKIGYGDEVLRGFL